MKEKMLFVLNIALFTSMQSCLPMVIDAEKTDTKKEKHSKVRLSRTKQNTIYFKDVQGKGTHLRMQLANYSPTGEPRIAAPKHSQDASTEEHVLNSVHNLSEDEHGQAFALVTDDNRLGLYYRESLQDTGKPTFIRKASVSCFTPLIKKIKQEGQWVFAKYDTGETQKGYNSPEKVQDRYKIAVAMLKREPIGRMVRPIHKEQYRYILSDFKTIPRVHHLSAVHNSDNTDKVGIVVSYQDRKTTTYTTKDFEASYLTLKKKQSALSSSGLRRSSKNIV